MTHPSSPDRVSAERNVSRTAPRTDFDRAVAIPNTARSYTLRKLIQLAYALARNIPNDKAPVRTHDEAVEYARELLAKGFLRFRPIHVTAEKIQEAIALKAPGQEG